MSYVDTPQFKLYRALKKGDIDSVKSYVLQGGDITFIDPIDKWSYLHQVFVSPSDKRIVPTQSIQFLLDQGLDVNAIDSYGNTPLIYAVRQRNVDGMRLLLENGADKLLEHENKDSVDALRMGFDRMPLDYDVFEVLFKFGASPDRKNSSGTTARELLNILGGVDSSIYDLFAQY